MEVIPLGGAGEDTEEMARDVRAGLSAIPKDLSPWPKLFYAEEGSRLFDGPGQSQVAVSYQPSAVSFSADSDTAALKSTVFEFEDGQPGTLPLSRQQKAEG